MLDKGADVNSGSSPGFTGITEVFERDLPERREILEVLIRRGADLNARGRNNWTPVYLAGYFGDLEALRMIVGAGADLTVRTIIDNDRTPFEEARDLEWDPEIIAF